MARSNFIYTVTIPSGPGGSLVPLQGIGITAYSINPDETEGMMASFYAGRTGTTPGVGTTDANGTVNVWLETGDYNIHFDDEQTPVRITSFIVGFSPVQLSDALADLASSVSFTGDLKWSNQTVDHGLNSDGNHDWLQIVQDSDGGGRKINHLTYPGLWEQLGSDPPDIDGNFRLPNVSDRALIATGDIFSAVTLRQLFGNSTANHSHSLSTSGMAAISIDSSTGQIFIVGDPGPSVDGLNMSAVTNPVVPFNRISPSFQQQLISLLGETDNTDLNITPLSCGMNLFIKS